MLTRNFNPYWGTDRNVTTAVLRSLSNIDFTKFPNGSMLDLRFDPEPLQTEEGRERFMGFLKAFVDLVVIMIFSLCANNIFSIFCSLYLRNI